MKIILSLIVLLVSSVSFSMEEETVEGSLQVRVVSFENTRDYIRLNRPHVIIDDKIYRFGANRPTYEGLCTQVLEGIFGILEVEDGFKSIGNVYLNQDGERIRLGAVARSFSSIKCLKQ